MDCGHVVLGLFVVLIAAAACRFELIHVRSERDVSFTQGCIGDRYFHVNQEGVIFYTTGLNLLPDTDTCVLPNNGVIPGGK